MRAIAQERRRFGYRRLHVLLRREGYLVNHKKLFRLYREEKLTVRRRTGRKRAIGTRAPMLVPMIAERPMVTRLVSDQLTCGRRFRILTVVDDCTRECLALVADTSLSGTRVARELDRLMIERGKPSTVVRSQGRRPEDARGRRQRIVRSLEAAASRHAAQIDVNPRSRGPQSYAYYSELSWH
ncbi:transposase InsO family protein [Bradyrhizobium sp. RT9a]